MANSFRCSPNLIPFAVNAMVGSRSWFGGFFNRVGYRRHGAGEKSLDYVLTPLQVS